MSIDPYAPAASDLVGIYQDLHVHPEPSFQETRTAAIVADHLRRLGYQTATNVGRTGVVGIVRNGQCPTAFPPNHSPRYAPVIEPTLSIGVAALVTAAQTWLPPTI